MVFFCACGDTTTETSEDVVEEVTEEVVELENANDDSFDPGEYLDDDSEQVSFEDAISDLDKDAKIFAQSLSSGDYDAICDIYGINRDDFPDAAADSMLIMALDGESPETILYEYVDSYEMPTETSTEETSQIVYVTRTGSKYHSYGCQYLKKSCIEKDLSVAQSQGYTPCSKCY